MLDFFVRSGLYTHRYSNAGVGKNNSAPADLLLFDLTSTAASAFFISKKYESDFSRPFTIRRALNKRFVCQSEKCVVYFTVTMRWVAFATREQNAASHGRAEASCNC